MTSRQEKFARLVAGGMTQSIDRRGRYAAFSPRVGVFMPGVDIRAPHLRDGYRVASGTSLAAAAYAGMAAARTDTGKGGRA